MLQKGNGAHQLGTVIHAGQREAQGLLVIAEHHVLGDELALSADRAEALVVEIVRRSFVPEPGCLTLDGASILLANVAEGQAEAVSFNVVGAVGGGNLAQLFLTRVGIADSSYPTVASGASRFSSGTRMFNRRRLRAYAVLMPTTVNASRRKNHCTVKPPRMAPSVGVSFRSATTLPPVAARWQNSKTIPAFSRSRVTARPASIKVQKICATSAC